jgi:adenylosuccinate lyase
VLERNLIMPGNPRYQPAQLRPVFGYDNLYRPVIEVEVANIKTLAELNVIPPKDYLLLTSERLTNLLSIRATDVDAEERKTGHDVKALINLARTILGPELGRWFHLVLTSYDPLDTGRTLQFIHAHRMVVRPLMRELIGCFAESTRELAAVKQIGRTHGQHALPITVGFWLATLLDRQIRNLQAADEAANRLVGKISGAVGAYNAQVALGLVRRCAGGPTYEERVLAKLGLKPAPISTQILPPEPLADYLWACFKLSATLGQFGRDARHLMRTEIGELSEPFGSGQTGSSTMAHKRNPMTFEGVEGAFLRTKSEFGKVLDSMISEHQRDLVGSALLRDFPIIVINLVYQLTRLLNKKEATGIPFVRRIKIDAEACERNLAQLGDSVLAEPIYCMLQAIGYTGDAHALINHEALALAKGRQITLFGAVAVLLDQSSPELAELWKDLPDEERTMLTRPADYLGLAEKKALEVADRAQAYLAS